jgi:hypothetical protein
VVSSTAIRTVSSVRLRRLRRLHRPRRRKDRLIGSFKLCLTVAGEIGSVTQLKSTGFGAYDQKILRTIRGEWRYKPFEVNGKAVPVCTAVTFIYSQK